MKIAVLISGEYRKFDITRKTMSFLDDPDVDVYVSTWDKTTYSSPKINLHIEEIVTKDRILSDLGRIATIKLDNHDLIVEKKYNSKMINRWLAGWKLIQDSGIKYDRVLVIRPDLFFEIGLLANLVEIDVTNSIAFSWATALHLEKLPEVLFVSTYENIQKLFNALSIDKWVNDSITDWHIWWYKFVYGISPNIICLDIFYLAFCRLWVEQHHTIVDAMRIHHDWRDLRLLYECDMWGDEFAITAWPPHILIEAREKWNRGYFDKYK